MLLWPLSDSQLSQSAAYEVFSRQKNKQNRFRMSQQKYYIHVLINVYASRLAPCIDVGTRCRLTELAAGLANTQMISMHF